MARLQPNFESLPGLDAAPLSAEVTELLRYGLQRYEGGDFVQAARVFEALVGASPERSLSWNHFALALVSLGRDAEAVTALHRSLAIEATQVEAWNSLAGACLRLGRDAEADAACGAVLALDGENATAWQMRALARTALNDFVGAAEAFGRSIEIEGETAPLCANLGASLMKGGCFEEAAAAFGRAVALDPAAAPIADAKALCDLTLAALAGQALDAPEADFDRMFKTALLLLDSFGRRDAASRVAEAWAARRPDNVEALHLRDAALARRVERQPAALVAQRFDELAKDFDEHLLVRLSYAGPEQLKVLLASRIEPRGELDVLDLGCGTGLCGEALRPYARSLSGVDLSSGMLAKAEERGLYDRLELADLLDVLRREPAAWDMLVAFDTFPYLGALEAAFDAAAQALKPGGWFAFSTEAAYSGDYVLHGNGRYAHTADYIAILATGRFAIAAQTTDRLRLEGGRMLDGGYFLLRAL